MAVAGAGAGLSSVLKNLQSKLSSPVLDGFGRLSFGKKDKLTLESILSAIAAVLQDAERRQLNEIAVRDWLRMLKDAVYDMEDALDGFVVESLRRDVEKKYGILKRVHIFFS
ncbi:hypothetical protein AAC387_Pa11g0082 [Persea americana]